MWNEVFQSFILFVNEQDKLQATYIESYFWELLSVLESEGERIESMAGL